MEKLPKITQKSPYITNEKAEAMSGDIAFEKEIQRTISVFCKIPISSFVQTVAFLNSTFL